jgi:hypothetical protein
MIVLDRTISLVFELSYSNGILPSHGASLFFLWRKFITCAFYKTKNYPASSTYTNPFSPE